MGRAPCCDKDNVKKGPWSPEEDSKLKTYIEEHGTGNNWIALPRKVGLRRCGKSCRLRWLNYLRPNIKHGGFSEEEDRIICSLYISIGSRWSIIAAQLPGRTDNDIKNYWNTRLKKKLLGRRSDPAVSQFRQLCATDRLPKDDGSNPNPNGPTHALSASALERMQLHFQLQNLHSPFSFKPLQTLSSASPLNHLQQTSLCNSVAAGIQENTGIPSSSCSINLEAELHDLVYGYKDNQPTQGNCLNETIVEEGIGWWGTNGFEEKSTPNSWDLASALPPDAVLIQDYGQGYDS